MYINEITPIVTLNQLVNTSAKLGEIVSNEEIIIHY